jgi:hypothetical protein
MYVAPPPFVERPIPTVNRFIPLRIFGVVLASLIFTAGGLPSSFGQTTGVLTNLAQVRAVTLTDSTKGIPVALRATVTYICPSYQIVRLI